MLYTLFAVFLVLVNADSCTLDTVTIDIGVCNEDCGGSCGDMISCTDNVASNFMYDDGACSVGENADGSMTAGVCGELWGWQGFDASMVSCDATTATFEFCGDTATNVCAESVTDATSVDGCTTCRCEDYCCNTANFEAYSYSMWGVWEVECACGTESEMNQRVADFDADWCGDDADCELLPSDVVLCGAANNDDDTGTCDDCIAGCGSYNCDCMGTTCLDSCVNSDYFETLCVTEMEDLIAWCEASQNDVIFSACDYDETCNPDFQDSLGFTCWAYESENWCTEDGKYGSGWQDRVDPDATMAMYEQDGQTAANCPQCGCTGGTDEDSDTDEDGASTFAAVVVAALLAIMF